MEKISVISGGGSGLGLKIAELLVESGKNVIILGRDKTKLEAAELKLKTKCKGNFVKSLVCNVGEQKDTKNVGNFITKNRYYVDYLYNNAGKGLFTKAENSTSELIDSIFEANLKGMILLTSEVLRLTPSEEELTIVNIMSTSSLFGRSEETIYCAAKWGARGYTEALRTELKGARRNIIAVYPGGMLTDFWNIQGQDRDITSFMDPADVAEKIVNAVLVTDKLFVTDITINRKQ